MLSNVLSAPAVIDFRRSLSAFRYRLQGRYARLLRAWRYLRGSVTESDAFAIMRECYVVTGSYPLETLDVSALLEQAQDQWGEHPDLPRLCSDAAERVYGKWSSDGHLRGAAEEWALGLVEEYAKADGIELVEQED